MLGAPKYDLGFVTWQQEIVKNLFLEAAATWQDAHWDAVRYGNVTLYADPNYYLPDGGAGSTGPAAVNPVKNPYAGNYYVEGVPQFWVSDSRVENYRVTLSYELNLGKNLGRHRFAFLAERDEFEILTVARTELARVDGVIATQTANNPTNAVGNINRRHYITDPTNPRDYRMPPVYGIPVPLDMMTPDGRRLTTELANRFSADQPDYWKTINTTMVVLQSAWLSGHLNTIFGMRHDKATYRDWGTYKIKPDQGAFERDPNNFAVTSYPGRTYTYAAVAHLTTWLSAFFNASTSVGEPRYKVSYAPDGRQMETMTGIGKDIGIKFSIPRTQLQGIVTFYDATSTNEPLTDGVTTFVNNNNRILSSLVDSGVMTQSEVAYLHARGSGDTADAATKGVEAVMVGNVTKNWSIRASYSYTNRTVTRVFPRMNEWMDNVMKPFWEMLAERVNPYSPDGLSILDSVMYSGRPIRELAETMTTDLRQNTLSSSKVRGTRPHKVRIFTTYGFESGALKGLRIGGGFLYDSPGILEQDDRGKNRYGSSFTRYDFMMAYTRRMLKANWTIQLNINNCFHPKAAVNGPAFINPAGTWESIGVIAPREISLSVRTVF